MIEALYEFAATAQAVLTGPHDLHPEEREVVVRAAARVVAEEPPLFKGDPNKLRTLSTVLAIAYREGSLRIRVQGDCTESQPGQPCKGKPRSFCTMQIHTSIGGSEKLNDDPEACFRAGLRVLRASVRICAEHPVAWYAVGGPGPSACKSVRGKRISIDRMYLARKVYDAGATRLSLSLPRGYAWRSEGRSEP